jgi:alkylation response protein AidB-like acyl-CoA dehydrogenase
VPADAAGISYGKKEEKMGWNAQPTRMVTFDNVRVPVANRLGEEGQGFAIAMEGSTAGASISPPAASARRSRRCRRRGLRGRAAQFGQAIASSRPRSSARGHAHGGGGGAADGAPGGEQARRGDPQATTYCAMAKRFATDAGFRVCNEALQLFGGYGYIREYPMERHVRDTRVHQILEGTNEIMRVIIARSMMMDGALEVIR